MTMNLKLISCCLLKKPANKKFKIIFEEGEKKLIENFDLLKIIKDIKYIKTLVEFHLKPEHKLKF